MKLRCERDVLAEALTTASRAVPSRAASLPVLAGIHMSAFGEQLQITGTDLDLTIRTTVLTTVTAEGSCVASARLITDIVRLLPSGAVTLEATTDEIHISSGRSQYTVRALDATQFPQIASTQDFTAKLPVDELGEALRQVVRAASTDDARPLLTGVYLTAEEHGMRMVATDSYRLAVRDLAQAEILRSGESVIVPSRALGELARLLSSVSEDINVALAEREIVFSLGDVQLTSRLIEGHFPDYKPLIPREYPNHLRVDRDVFTEAVRRVKVLAKDATTPVRLSLRADGVELQVVSQEIGQATEEIEAKYEGEALTVAFNPGFLIDGLESLPSGDVVLETVDALKPATLKADNSDDFFYLIMPIRVS